MGHLMTKPTKWYVHPAKTQISLGIRPVWSESSLCAQWIAKNPSFLHADNEDWSDWADAQADLSLGWAHISVCWFCRVVAQIRFVPPVKTQNSLHIWAVWSESSLKIQSLTMQTEKIDKTVWMCRLIWFSALCLCQFVGLIEPAHEIMVLIT